MIRRHINQPFAELAQALITSRLDTCNSLLHSLNKTQLKRLQRLQNTAVRLVTLSRKCIHITPILKQLHWLSTEQRIIFKMSMFVLKTIHGASPTYLCSIVKPYEPLRGNIRSANKLLLTEYKSKTCGERDRSPYPQQRPGIHFQTISESAQQSKSSRQL